MGFAFTVAWRFLREGRFQTLLIVVGVAAGVAVVTYISALIQGLQGNTIERTLGTQAHLTVKPREERTEAVLGAGAASNGTLARDVQPRAQRLRTLDDWRGIEAEMARLPGVLAVTSVVNGAALAQRGEASRAISIIGIDFDGYDRIVALRSRVVAGEARVAPGEALVGRQLAEDLGLVVGDRLVVRAGGAGGTGAADTFKIAGLFDIGNRDLNRRFVYVTQTSAQSLLGIPGGMTNTYARVADLFGAAALAATLRARTGVEVESWMDSNAQLLSALQAQSISTGLIRVFTSIVVMLGIASVLVVSVVQKRKEIGILRAMGATRAQMTQVFLLQGAIVGWIGSLAGVALAQGLLWAFSTFAKGSDGRPLFVVGLPLDLALAVALMATAAGVLAAVAPARRAARLDPAQAIRL
ncbi:MAG: FtsX-like permease family protein [Burkholderiaceae bacterium]|nr:FtsX-like permease family protein [Burkholderiaceae bacterium]